ncbi:putative integral ER membrane protein Scs2 [Aspergillus undulatus]|uniref:putative integral ER membrane protein Scs2 n=1 Tax=Aspergillus undulatus TaxID=1810928 RepID=UPI003CCD918B
MSILLDPPELGFERPFNREICQVLHLTNNNPDAVVFKVKTTAPKHYCVRPNSGRIEPGKHVEVQVLLQAMKDEPAADAKCKDKFLVQTVAVTKDMEFANVSSIFEKATKSAIQERKIRVIWLTPEVHPADNQEETNGANAQDDEPPAYTSPPKGDYETPAAGLGKSPSAASPIPAPDFNESAKREFSTPQVTEKTASAQSPTPSSGKPNDYEARLSDANAQIQRLKDKLADQGLRQRKIGGESDKSAAGLVQQAQAVEAGVPVKIVASLCLLSFLIAYFFF